MSSKSRLLKIRLLASSNKMFTMVVDVNKLTIDEVIINNELSVWINPPPWREMIPISITFGAKVLGGYYY
jgi:hypothetical protein